MPDPLKSVKTRRFNLLNQKLYKRKLKLPKRNIPALTYTSTNKHSMYLHSTFYILYLMAKRENSTRNERERDIRSTPASVQLRWYSQQQQQQQQQRPPFSREYNSIFDLLLYALLTYLCIQNTFISADVP